MKRHGETGRGSVGISRSGISRLREALGRPTFCLGLASSLSFGAHAFAQTPAAQPSSAPVATPAQSVIAQKPAPRFVPIESYNQMVRYVRSLGEEVQRLKKSQPNKEGASGSAAATEEIVDLSSLTTEGVAVPAAGGAVTPGAVGGGHGSHGHGGAGTSLGFKLYFDLNLISRPGVEDFSFDNFHTLLLAEITPSSRTMFSFEVSTNPRYYELDYNLTESFQIRAGKIWIPFDDMAPHNIFGGRINVSRLAVGSAFLPDLWTDLGVGFKWTLWDKAAFTADLHGYVVNGFRSGGTDPRSDKSTAPKSAEAYPSFGDLPTAKDNNRDKMLGGRLALKFFRKLSLGASFATGRWTSEDVASKRYTILGSDAQLRFKRTEFRVGYATASTNLFAQAGFDVAKRQGLYAEVGQKFGSSDQFKILFRGGQVELDDRAFSVTDQRLVGGTLLWQPGPIQVSIEHSRDLWRKEGKTNYEFTNLRLVVAL